MAGEIQVAHTATSVTLYAIIRDSNGNVWDTVSTSFVSYATADIDDYDISLTEEGTASQYYLGTFPSDISAGIYSVSVYEQDGASPAEGDIIVATGNIYWDGSAVANLDDFKYDTDLYHADIELTIDESNLQDEYTVTWFKNGVRITSGITSPTMQVIKRADGTDLISSTPMTEIGSTASYKYDESTDRITDGESVIAVAGATIDGSSRSFTKLCSRDS